MKQKLKLYFCMLKSLFIKPKDTKWIVIVAALVITMVSMLSSVGENIEKSFLQAIYQTSQYDYMITDMELQEAKDYESRISEQYAGAASAITTDAFSLNIPDSDFYLNVIGMQGAYKEIYRLEVEEGEFPQGENEIALDSRVKDRADQRYQIGDVIELEIWSQKTSKWEKVCYRISGFFSAQNSGEYELYGFTSLDGAMNALEKAEEEINYAVMVKVADSSTGTVLEMLQDIDAGLRERIILNQVRYDMLTESEEADNAFVKVFRYLGIIVALVSFALLFNMFRLATVQRIRQLGLLRCIGINKKQMFLGLFLNLVLYLGSSMGIGFLLYSVSETLFGRVILRRFLEGFQISTNVEMQWEFNVVSFFQSAALVLLIMALVYCNVIWRVLGMTPLAAVEYRGEGKVAVPKRKEVKKSVISFLGKRNLLRNKWRSFYTAMTVFAMSLLIGTVVTIMGNIDLFEVDALKKGNLFDYEFFGNYDTPFADTEDLEKLAGLQSVEKICGARRRIDDFYQDEEAVIKDDTFVETRVYADDLFARICEENKVNYENVSEQPIYLLLSAEPSEVNEILLYDKQMMERRLPIYAVISKDNYDNSFPEEGRVYIVMNEEAAREQFGELTYNVLFVEAKEKALCLAQMSEYLQSEGITMYYNDLKQSNSDARTQLQSILCVAIYLVFCIGLMAVVNIICNVSINIQMRVREYGIMMSMGMSRRQIVQLIVYEIMDSVGKAVILAVPLSVMISLGCISMVGQQPNIMKVVFYATGCGLLVYGINYLVCFLKGRYDFSKNIVELMHKV